MLGLYIIIMPTTAIAENALSSQVGLVVTAWLYASLHLRFRMWVFSNLYLRNVCTTGEVLGRQNTSSEQITAQYGRR